MNKCDVVNCMGDILDKCPSCSYKNITYSQYCDMCGFSWEIYAKQEKLNTCDKCEKEIKLNDQYGTDEENDKVYCKECVI